MCSGDVPSAAVLQGFARCLALLFLFGDFMGFLNDLDQEITNPPVAIQDLTCQGDGNSPEIPPAKESLETSWHHSRRRDWIWLRTN